MTIDGPGAAGRHQPHHGIDALPDDAHGVSLLASQERVVVLDSCTVCPCIW
jgi:hypothetical protein